MKHLIFAIRDSKAELYSQPVCAVSQGAAIRAFSDEVNNPQSQYGKHPGDYTLFAIAQYNDETGTVLPLEHGHVDLGNGARFVTRRDDA